MNRVHGATVTPSHRQAPGARVGPSQPMGSEEVALAAGPGPPHQASPTTGEWEQDRPPILCVHPTENPVHVAPLHLTSFSF